MTAPHHHPTSSKSKQATWLAALALTLLGLLQFLPHLSTVDFHHEEGRRVIPALEMLKTGDWIVPTIWGEPYLSKPPGIFWLMAASMRAFGELSTFAPRLVSVLASLATMLGLLWAGKRIFGLRAGILGALFFLVCKETLDKSRLAEIEASLACAVFFSTTCWWFGRRGSIGWSVASGIFLGVAILLKGPAALIFFAGGPLALAWKERSLRPLFSARLLIPLSIGVCLPTCWMFALFAIFDSGAAGDTWSGQIGGQGGRTLAIYAAERGHFFLGSVLACFPASFVLLFSLGTEEGKQLVREDSTLFALATVAAGWLFFMIFPGTSVRYFYPALPLVALAAGSALDRASSKVFLARLNGLALFFCGLGALVFVTAVVGFFVDLGDLRIDATGLGIAGLVLLIAIAAWRQTGFRRQALALIVIPLAIEVLLTNQLTPGKAERQSRAPYARKIDAALVEGEVLNVCFWSDFNTMLYVDHEIELAGSWEEVPSGEAALVNAAQWTHMTSEGADAQAFTLLLEVKVRRSHLRLIRVHE